MAGSPMDRIEVSGIELAELANRIAKERCISFCDALPLARREMEFADSVPLQVTRNTGSPLRDQTTSSTPSAAQVRQAVVAGLNNCKNYISQAHLIGMFAVNYSAEMVEAEFLKLGLGPQVISALKAELVRYLSSLINPSLGQPDVLNATQVSTAISEAGDHMQQIYAAALANKVDTQVWSDGHVSCYVSGDSIHLRDRAVQIQNQRGVFFGEALTLARRGARFADDVVDSGTLGTELSAFLKNAFGQLFQGAQEKVIQSTDVLTIADNVRDTLQNLQMGAAAGAVQNAIKDALRSYTGRMSVSDVNSAITKVVAAAQNAYTNAISQS